MIKKQCNLLTLVRTTLLFLCSHRTRVYWKVFKLQFKRKYTYKVVYSVFNVTFHTVDLVFTTRFRRRVNLWQYRQMKWNLFDKKWINKTRENYLILLHLYDWKHVRLTAFKNTCLQKKRVRGSASLIRTNSHTCVSTCCIHDSSRSLYLKRQHHGTRFGQTGVCGHGNAQVRGEEKNLRLHQEKGLRCHQKPPPQQGNWWCDLGSLASIVNKLADAFEDCRNFYRRHGTVCVSWNEFCVDAV